MLRMTRLREERGLSQAEICRRTTINASDLSKIESGRIKPYPGQLSQLARALGWPASRATQLMDEIADPEPRAASAPAIAPAKGGQK